MREGWVYKKLGEVSSFSRGLTYSKNDVAVESSKKVLRSNNIDLATHSLIFDDVACLKEEFVIPSDKKLRQNDIFICMSNGSTQHLGKVAFIEKDIDYAFGGFMGTIHPQLSVVYPKFAFYYCMSAEYRRSLASVLNGININNLKWSDLSKFSIPIPPLSEQQRIVSELDLLSSIIEKKKAQLKEYDQLAQSIFYDIFASYEDNTPTSNFILSLKGGKSLAGDEECKNKILKTGAVTYDFFKGDEVKNLPKDYIPLSENLLNDGDLLVSRMNTLEYVGAVAYVWKAPNNTYLPDRLWRAKLNDNVNPIFLWFSLKQPKAKEQIRSLSSGTSGSMKNISIPRFLSILIKNPPLSLQQSFAEKVEAIEKQKTLVQQSIVETQTMFDFTMDKYFG